MARRLPSSHRSATCSQPGDGVTPLVGEPELALIGRTTSCTRSRMLCDVLSLHGIEFGCRACARGQPGAHCSQSSSA